MKSDNQARRLSRSLPLGVLVLFFALPFAFAESATDLVSTWPQAHSVQRDKDAGWLRLSTPYYTVRHDLKQGGAIASIRLTHGIATNLLVRPFETRIQDASGVLASDLNEPTPRVTTRREGLNELVTVESTLRDAAGKPSGVQVKTVYEYRWGYVKMHKQLTFRGEGLPAKEICPVSTVLARSLSAYGYRDGLTEEEGAPAFSFGSCHWGKLTAEAASAVQMPCVPRYVMFTDPGVEGLEWFVCSDLAQWDLQLTGKRGQGRSVLQASSTPVGIAFSVSPFQNAQAPVVVSAPLQGEGRQAARTAETGGLDAPAGATGALRPAEGNDSGSRQEFQVSGMAEGHLRAPQSPNSTCPTRSRTCMCQPARVVRGYTPSHRIGWQAAFGM